MHPIRSLTTAIAVGLWTTLAFCSSAAQAVPSTPSSPMDTMRYWQRRTVWRTVRVPEGGFSILMPEQPRFPAERRTKRSRSRRGSRDSRLDAQYVTAFQPSYGALYMVGWSDDALELNDSKSRNRRRQKDRRGSRKRRKQAREAQVRSLFASEREQLLARFGGTLLSETPVYLNGYSGQHYQFRSTIDNEGYIITHRSYWVRDRFYQMTVAVPDHRYPGFIGIAEGFMRSFQPD